MNGFELLALVAVIVICLVAIDRWHQRRAWREAQRWARAQMDRRHLP